MGGNISSTASSSTTDIISGALTEHTQSAIDNLKQKVQMSQLQVITMEDLEVTGGCEFIGTQTMDADISATMQTLYTMSSETVQNVAATAAQELEHTIRQKNEGLNLAQANIADASSHLSSEIETAIRTAQEQMSESIMDMDAVMHQEQNIELKNIRCDGEGSKVTFNQDMALRMFAEKVSTNLFESTSNQDSLASSTQVLKMAVDQHNKGLDIMAMVISSLIACVIFAIVAGLTSSKMYEDTPDEAKVHLAETAGEIMKARTGTMGGGRKGGRKGHRKIKTDRIEHLIKYGGFGPVTSAVGGGLLGAIVAGIIVLICYAIYSSFGQPCVHEDENTFSDQRRSEERKDCVIDNE